MLIFRSRLEPPEEWDRLGYRGTVRELGPFRCYLRNKGHEYLAGGRPEMASDTLWAWCLADPDHHWFPNSCCNQQLPGRTSVTGCRIALGWNICLTQNAFVQLDQFASNP